MSEQTTTAITPYAKLKTMITSDEIQARFRQVLGDKAPGFLASVINTVYLNESLRDADPNSVLTSAIKAAVLDLPIDPNLGFAWIIPYKDHGKPIAQFQMGYKGYIQLALRSSQYFAINAAKIYQGEQVIEDRLTGRIKLNGKKVSDEVTGYVGYFQLSNGFEKHLYMTVDQVHAHAKQYSKSYGKPGSAWTTNFDDMGKKTVLKLLISKYGIMSIQMIGAIKIDNDDLSIRLTADQDTGEITGEIFDTTFTEDIPQPPAEDEPPAPPVDDVADRLVADKKIDNAPHTRNIIAKRKQLCKFDEYEFVVAYNAWKDYGATDEQAANYANKGELPK